MVTDEVSLTRSKRNKDSVLPSTVQLARVSLRVFLVLQVMNKSGLI